jgi:hypothetical protein
MMDWNTEIREGVMSCPVCHDENGTHVDGVLALTRAREDSEPVYLALLADGRLNHVRDGEHPNGFADTGRRHEFALVGWCEMCGGNWALVFRQHKGQTLIKVMTEGVVCLDPR